MSVTCDTPGAGTLTKLTKAQIFKVTEPKAKVMFKQWFHEKNKTTAMRLKTNNSR